MHIKNQALEYLKIKDKTNLTKLLDKIKNENIIIDN